MSQLVDASNYQMPWLHCDKMLTQLMFTKYIKHLEGVQILI